MTRVGDPIPTPVFVPVEDGRHIVYAARQVDVEQLGYDVVYATTLCGLPCGAGPVANRRAAKGPPDCTACRAEDDRRWPSATSRRLADAHLSPDPPMSRLEPPEGGRSHRWIG